MWRYMSCDIHTHTPAQKSYTNFITLFCFLNMFYNLAWGMGMNGTAQYRRIGARHAYFLS